MEKTTSTVAIDSDLFDAIRLLIDTKVVEAESVGLFVEELIQKEIQRRKTDERSKGQSRSPATAP
jgi:hypothetical protein